MAPTLTIRNITSLALEIKHVERSERSKQQLGISENVTTSVTKTFTGLLAKATGKPSLSPEPPAEPKEAHYKREDVFITLPAFTSTSTQVPTLDTSIPEQVSLVIEVGSEQYSLALAAKHQSSATFSPLSDNAKRELYAIYHPQHSHLSIYSASQLSSWMRPLRDPTPLSALSIPGTHNSPTCHNALPSVRCQAVPPRAQLENGVRFFDIRVQPGEPADPSKDTLILVHGVFPISLTGPKYFRALADEVLSFLAANPSETVIISLKREGTGQTTDQQLAHILKKHYATDPAKWYTDTHIPTLGEVRGKIVLIRRFCIDDELRRENGGRGFCIDAETWQDNTANDTCPAGTVCVQDFYQVMETENIETKTKLCKEHLERAGAVCCALPPEAELGTAQIDGPRPEPGKQQPFFINFLSASNFWKVGCWPDRIAAKLNPAMVEFLCLKHAETEGGEKRGQVGDGGTGIVVCDWVGNNGDWDLVRCIVGMNAKLAMREGVAG
ncbi:hypothetical protein MMC25_001783 [Agyrium rufum]|nr:hypothetical protein [Agyrium rufum]